MKRRNITPTAAKLHALFEYRDSKLYWRVSAKCGGVSSGDVAGYVTPDGYVRIGIEGVSYSAHRLIWRMHHPRGPMPFIIDHADGNRSNNDIQNLRKATHSENMYNRHKGKAYSPRSTGRLRELLGQ